jgi:hypothetical protein
MARYRSRRHQRKQSEHGRAIFLLWVLFAAGTQLFKFLAPADRNDDATMLFYIISIIACIMWITDNISAVAMVFFPGLAAALVFEGVSTSKDRAAWLFFIGFSPFFLGYAAFWSLSFFFVLWATISWLPFVLYRCSFRYLMIRLPQYRRTDPYVKSKLCESCRTMLKSSSLLFGSWTIFVRTQELHKFYGSIEEIQLSWQGCNLCEALMSQRLQDGDAAGIFRGRNYGTISSTASIRSLSVIEKGSLMVKIQLHKSSSFRDTFGLQFTIRLESPDKNRFKELRIVEGMFSR